MGILKQIIRRYKKYYSMSIYDYDTFEIKNILEAKSLKRKFPNRKINLLHRHSSIIWQGPIYVKILSEKLRNKNFNYIVEIGDNIALTLLLISFKVKILAIDKKKVKNQMKRIFSITKKKEIKFICLDKLKIIENY